MTASRNASEPDSELEAAARNAIAAELSTIPSPSQLSVLDDLSGREAFWTAFKLEERLQRRETLTPEEIRWLHGYQGTNYYRTWRDMYADFGESMFDGMEAVSF